MRGSPGHTLRFELSKSDERGRKNPQLHTGKTGFIIQGKSYSRVWRDEIAHAGGVWPPVRRLGDNSRLLTAMGVRVKLYLKEK